MWPRSFRVFFSLDDMAEAEKKELTITFEINAVAAGAAQDRREVMEGRARGHLELCTRWDEGIPRSGHE